MTRAEWEEQLRSDAACTEDALRALLNERTMPALLRDSMSYSLFAGGKKLRPALCLESCRMLSGDMLRALFAACAMELIHTYSLIHDDLPAMDNDDMRRGKPSNHIAFGEANAILAGDGLLSLAFEAVAQTQNTDVMRAIACGAFDMVAGQSLDLSGAADEQALYRIHRLKTGALIRAAVLSGAYCAAGSPEELAALTEFADAYGLLFQITDDILDATGDEALLGKTVGKDASAGKLTFVSLYGLDGARTRAKAESKRASDALSRFSGRAAFFLALIDATLDRQA